MAFKGNEAVVTDRRSSEYDCYHVYIEILESVKNLIMTLPFVQYIVRLQIF
jgi:hypothetical protein